MKTFPRYPRLAHAHSPRIRRIGIAVAALVAAAGTAFACSDSGPSEPPDLSGTFFGPVTVVASGSGRAYVILDASGAPTNLGVALTASAMANLPNDAAEYVFALPSQAGSTPFKHAAINWAPQGHPPPMIYTVPHFDFHFYTISEAERLAIDPADPQWATKVGSFPAPQFWPERFYPLSLLMGVPADAVGVPLMGMHWLGVAAPELHGAEFTETFFYGSWDGALIFAEPMITKKTLESRVSVDKTLPEAPVYAPAGMHAGGYRVYYDAERDRHRVALTQFIERN